MKIEQFPVFGNLNPTQFANFLAACTEENYPAGASIIKQGDHGEAVFFMIEGEARVSILNDGERLDLALLRPPAVIGEMELLTGEPRAATVEAKTEVSALMMPFDLVLARVKDGDVGTLKVIYTISRVLAHRLAAMDHKLAELPRREDLADFRRNLLTDWHF